MPQFSRTDKIYAKALLANRYEKDMKWRIKTDNNPSQK